METVSSKKDLPLLLEKLVNEPNKWLVIAKEDRVSVVEKGNKKYKKLGEFYPSAQWGNSTQYVIFRPHNNA